MKTKHKLAHTKGSLFLASLERYLKAQECEESLRECSEQTGERTLLGLCDLIILKQPCFHLKNKGIPLKGHFKRRQSLTELRKRRLSGFDTGLGKLRA